MKLLFKLSLVTISFFFCLEAFPVAPSSCNVGVSSTITKIQSALCDTSTSVLILSTADGCIMRVPLAEAGLFIYAMEKGKTVTVMSAYTTACTVGLHRLSVAK